MGTVNYQVPMFDQVVGAKLESVYCLDSDIVLFIFEGALAFVVDDGGLQLEAAYDGQPGPPKNFKALAAQLVGEQLTAVFVDPSKRRFTLAFSTSFFSIARDDAGLKMFEVVARRLI